ncbi:DNA-directed RNA polymerase subunit beta [Macrococcus lamae]|nr:DNA-directed RNA polymerase subunit beta [Macrococcus lamae]
MQVEGTEIVRRKIPMMMIVVVVALLSLLLFIAGLMLGYGILHSPLEVFNPKTWTHILKLTGAA